MSNMSNFIKQHNSNILSSPTKTEELHAIVEIKTIVHLMAVA